MTKQVRKEVKKFNNMKPHPEQHVVLNPRIEHIVRAFYFQGDYPSMLYNHVHLHNITPPTADVVVAKYHAGAKEFDIHPAVVTACAMRGVAARDVVNVLLSMDMDGMPVVSVDPTEIQSAAVTHLAALECAVHIVVNKPEQAIALRPDHNASKGEEQWL